MSSVDQMAAALKTQVQDSLNPQLIVLDQVMFTKQI